MLPSSIRANPGQNKVEPVFMSSTWHVTGRINVVVVVHVLGVFC